MLSPLLPLRRALNPAESVPVSFGGAILLHAAFAALILGWGLLRANRHKDWGEAAMQAGSIQATMVNSLPLPPRQRFKENAVLTSDKPSPAPEPPKPLAEPLPRPDEVLIPNKPIKPTRTEDFSTIEPPKHPQPITPQPNKATTGQTSGVRIPQAVTELKNGTASMTVEDRAFGDRFAYYVRIVNVTVARNWFTQEADPAASNGKRVTIVFDINREGIPSNAHIAVGSGSPTLDSSALRAVQRVDGFGPLPQGDRITVDYIFDYKEPQ